MNQKTPRILVTNDDGVHAEGIAALRLALEPLGDVIVVAPDRNRSGASNSLTLSQPLSVKKMAENVYAVEGTPTDCSHLALTGLFKDEPEFDIVVSGINAGANLGDDILYSGTVGAALEGRFLGKAAIAISLVEDNTHYETAGYVAHKLVAQVLKHDTFHVACLNVNVPNIPVDQIEGFEVTRMGERHPSENSIEQIDPRGRKIYWIGAAGKEKTRETGTDFDAVARNKVSITPLNVDFTDYRAFDRVSHWLDDNSQ